MSTNCFYLLIYYIMWRHKKIRTNDTKVTLTKSQESMAAEYSYIEPKDSAVYFKKMQEKSRTVENECKWWCCPASKDCTNPTPWCCEWCPKDFVSTEELDEKLKALLSTPSSDVDVDYEFYRKVITYGLFAFTIVAVLYLVKWLF